MKFSYLLSYAAIISHCMCVAQTFPVPTGYVNDFARVIGAQAIDTLECEVRRVEEQRGIEIVVITINSIAQYGEEKNFEHFATSLFNRWGIGKKGTDNGVMVLVAVEDRRVRIELGAGYPAYYNQIAHNIIQKTMIPHFKQGDYSTGICEGTVAILDRITKKVSWFEFYRWQIVLWFLISLFGGGLIYYAYSRYTAPLPKKKIRTNILGEPFYYRDRPWYKRWRGSNKGYRGGGGSRRFGGGKSSGGGASGGW